MQKQTMQGRRERTVILGAGLAGLSAAFHSGFPVFEAREEPGGAAGSVRKDGYVFDYGIHIIHSKNPEFYSFMQSVGATFVSHRRKGLIYSHGSYAPYPFQVNTSHLPLKIRLQCVMGYLLRQKKHEIRNYEDWLLQNFGNGFSRNFLIPYSEKFWGVHPREMEHGWATQQRVPRPRTFDVIKGAFVKEDSGYGSNSRFLYPNKRKAGFAGIAEAIAFKLPDIEYGMTATKIDPDRQQVHFNDGDRIIEYDQLITAIPLPELTSLVSDMPGRVKEAIGKLRFNSIAIVNLGVDRAHVDDNHWIHYADEHICFFRVSFPGNFCDGLCPEGTSMIQAEISYNCSTPPDADELVDRVYRELVAVGVLCAADSLVFRDVVYQKYAYVVFDHYREDAIRIIHGYLRGYGIYPCGRYGAWAYYWADEAIESGRQIAEEVLRKQGGNRR